MTKPQKDSSGRYHPWETNDGVYYSPYGTPCREVQRDAMRGMITLEFATLTTARMLEYDNPRIGQWTIVNQEIRLVSFLDTFKNA
jgi:hypothetical protein